MPPFRPENDAINAMMGAAARAEGRARTRRLGGPAPSVADAPVEPVEGGGFPLVAGAVEGLPAWTLDGLALRPGDVLEVYTNAANGWVRGRYEWSGQQGERPVLAVNLWDPHGVRDADGLPPWAGELLAEIPALAVCRRAV
jgi:hypothetical protein